MAMLKLSVILIVLDFAFFPCLTTSIGQYDYFQMVYQWQPAYCVGRKDPCRIKPSKIFTIHGLWPSNFSDIPGDKCKGALFNDSLMSQDPTLVSELQRSWPDVGGGDDMGFWGRQWNKHGTCSEQTFGQIQYFQRADAIWNKAKMNITMILKNNKISAGGGKYNYTHIEGVIKRAIGDTPIIRCIWRKRAQLLHEVVTCWSQDGQNLIKCNSTQKCSSNFDIEFL
ncbi:ribonuclease MC-like [Rosa rugosa]|uniref:ribonuclease MC-like n=1 Tax=Rosa rugosa TaxID=74645 RepID=UPI002B417D61|nr:ribonuclease MC-like [Rosa rugosa]